MSRCRNCNNPFGEENGWQEFCSVTCAMCYWAGRVVVEEDKIANNKAWKRWMAFWGNPKNHKYVRNGEPAKKPTIGKWVKRQVNASTRDGKGTKVVIIDVNVGGEQYTRPMTDDDREQIENQRKWGGWLTYNGNGNEIWRRIPSEQQAYHLAWFKHD